HVHAVLVGDLPPGRVLTRFVVGGPRGEDVPGLRGGVRHNGRAGGFGHGRVVAHDQGVCGASPGTPSVRVSPPPRGGDARRSSRVATHTSPRTAAATSRPSSQAT